MKHTVIKNGGTSVKDTGRHPAREAQIERDTAPSTRFLVNWKIRENEQLPVLEKSVTTAPQNAKDPDFDCCLLRSPTLGIH